MTTPEHEPTDSAEGLLILLATRGDGWYGGERVTQLEHGLQCAARAEAAGDPPALVLAALLHDIGHLLAAGAGAGTSRGDDRHEQIGAEALLRAFGPEVAEPVRLHVEAKRYLVASEPRYAKALSAESTRSLALQGGPMSTDACRAFVARPFAEHAIRLRRHDDGAKVPRSLSRTGSAARFRRIEGEQGGQVEIAAGVSVDTLRTISSWPTPRGLGHPEPQPEAVRDRLPSRTTPSLDHYLLLARAWAENRP